MLGSPHHVHAFGFLALLVECACAIERDNISPRGRAANAPRAFNTVLRFITGSS